VLGDTSEVSVVIHVLETPEVATRPLRVAVNVGAFSALERTASGVYHSTYRLPERRFPQVALIAVWRETGPDAPIEFLRIPLFGKADLPIETKRDAEVTVQVGDVRFGPKKADHAGKVLMPIVVPPGVEKVDVISASGNDKKVATVVVDVPPYNRLTL